jgi:hypothetical protein
MPGEILLIDQLTRSCMRIELADPELACGTLITNVREFCAN